MFSQRFPTYFDGIIAGSATYRLSVSYVDSAWGLQQLTAVAPPKARRALRSWPTRSPMPI